MSKHQLVIHTLPADQQRVIPNTPGAIRRVLTAAIKRNRRARLGCMLAICEATGGYETDALETATALGLEIHKAHGTRVRYFAKYKGLKAKNDPIDARVIALYGLQSEDLARYQPPSEAVKALRALQERRNDLKLMLQSSPPSSRANMPISLTTNTVDSGSTRIGPRFAQTRARVCPGMTVGRWHRPAQRRGRIPGIKPGMTWRGGAVPHNVMAGLVV